MRLAADPWATRIDRADALAAEGDSGAALVGFYGRLLRAQKRVDDALTARPPTGEIEDDLETVLDSATPLLKMVGEWGPDPLAAKARALAGGAASRLREELLEYWRARSDRLFFSKALLQPYAEQLARDPTRVIAGVDGAPDGRCPRCGGVPQLAIIEGDSSIAGEGGARSLQCATCLATWPFQRLRCPACGNEDERRLGYYQSPTFPYVRVDACEACGRYLKTIDLGRHGLAVPLVDEIASATLDVWATDRGYVKIELNLIGL